MRWQHIWLGKRPPVFPGSRTILHPQKRWCAFLSLHAPPSILLSVSWNSAVLTGVVVSHGFNLHFPDDTWCEISFHVLRRHLCIFFGEVSNKVFAPFLNKFVLLLLSFKSSLYVLDDRHLSDVSSAEIFSQSVACRSPDTFTEVLHLIKASLSFISWVLSSVLYLKSHFHTWGHSDSLFYLLGVSQFAFCV